MLYRHELQPKKHLEQLSYHSDAARRALTGPSLEVRLSFISTKTRYRASFRSVTVSSGSESTVESGDFLHGEENHNRRTSGSALSQKIDRCVA